MNNFLIFLIVFFSCFNVNASSNKIVEAYFKMEGKVPPSCYESLKNSLSVIHPKIRRYLIEGIQKRKSKYIFKKVSFEYAKNELYAGTIHGVPAYYASATTIFHTTNYCPKNDSIITHEIGHLIHSSIKSNHPALANQWTKLWNDIFRKHGSPKDPLRFPCPFDNCPFIGWKDADNESEGFAQLILAGTAHSPWRRNKHPDYLRKIKFLEVIKKRR